MSAAKRVTSTKSASKSLTVRKPATKVVVAKSVEETKPAPKKAAPKKAAAPKVEEQKVAAKKVPAVKEAPKAAVKSAPALKATAKVPAPKAEKVEKAVAVVPEEKKATKAEVTNEELRAFFKHDSSRVKLWIRGDGSVKYRTMSMKGWLDLPARDQLVKAFRANASIDKLLAEAGKAAAADAEVD